jgi:hypothetical protein
VRPKPTGYGPCRCPLNNKRFNLTLHAYQILSHIEHAHFIMGDEGSHKQKVERLESDGANWISYKSRLLLTFKHRKWFDHLTNATITQRYIDKGDVAGVTPSGAMGERRDRSNGVDRHNPPQCSLDSSYESHYCQSSLGRPCRRV